MCGPASQMNRNTVRHDFSVGDKSLKRKLLGFSFKADIRDYILYLDERQKYGKLKYIFTLTIPGWQVFFRIVLIVFF